MEKYILASVCTSDMIIDVKEYGTYAEAANAMETKVNAIPSEEITDCNIYDDSAYVLNYNFEYSWTIKKIEL